jgi:hypothetical protein
VFDWDEATVTDLQKSKWVFADSREMRKVRVPYTKFQKEHVSHIMRASSQFSSQSLQLHMHMLLHKLHKLLLHGRR